MQLTIDIQNEQLFERILWLLNSFKKDGLKIIVNKRQKIKSQFKSSSNVLDFSSFKVESFKNIDGLEYQKKIRDEW